MITHLISRSHEAVFFLPFLAKAIGLGAKKHGGKHIAKAVKDAIKGEVKDEAKDEAKKLLKKKKDEK